MSATSVLDWLKVLGPLLLAIAVGVATWNFQSWQVRLAKQKLRHDLYERRFAIYSAVLGLLVALIEQGSGEIKAAFQRASIARTESPFLFADPDIQAYLESLWKEIAEDVIGNIMFIEAMSDQKALLLYDAQARQDFAERTNRLGTSKLRIAGQHLPQLSEHFAKFLKLTDFWE